MCDRRSLLLSQLEIPWALFEYHAASLTDDDLFWAPTELQWTMRATETGWAPDLAESEPDPVPVTTPAWITWHIGWWWTAAIGQFTGAPTPAPDQVPWPGEAAPTVDWIRGIHQEWRSCLAGAEDLDGVVAYPWSEGSGKTLADLAGWVNVELTKNAAELGQLLIVRRARS